jgi:Protein of unknown function (DUF3179)
MCLCPSAVTIFRKMLSLLEASKISRRPLIWLSASALVSFLALFYPIYVIRPFRYQGPHELSAALLVLRLRPAIEIACVVIALVSLFQTWRKSSRIVARVVATVCTIAVIGFGILSRVNVYELMFHPLEKPSFSPGSNSKLDGREEVISVKIGGEARAYPVRSMSYHHIVNDTLGSVAIVATY